MTMTLLGAARPIQVLGFLGAVLGVGLILLSPYCGSILFASAGAIGVGADVAGLLSRSRIAGIAASLVKLIVVLGGTFLLIGNCRYVVAPAPVIPIELGPSLLLASTIPSVLGAAIKAFGR